MKITTLHINLYKSIKQPLSFSVLPVNILIGQNNCGKSNILYAIDYLFDVEGVSDILEYPKADVEAELEFTEAEVEEWKLPGQIASLTIKAGQRKLAFPKQIINYQGGWHDLFFNKIKHLNYESFNDFDQIDKDWQTLQDYKENLAQFKENLKNHFPKISAKENALNINHDQAGIKEGQRKATIDHLGSGFRRVFTTLLYIFHPDYPIVIIDEPETHLHPALVKKLLWAMQNSQAGQILFSTHSPIFLNSVTLPHVLRVVKGKNTTQAFGLPVAKRHYSYKRLIQELNADNVEMFFADTVVLVEGVSDRILIRGLIDRFYQGNKDIKVVQTHGKGNMALYSDLLKIFNIDYVIVVDRDIIKYQLDRLLQHLDIKPHSRKATNLILELKEHHIFIFPSGAIEKHYPKKYQRDDKKPLNALYAATAITKTEFNSKIMKPLKEIINDL
jgi:predicted ATP-dependent endonuclease of OLD family